MGSYNFESFDPSTLKTSVEEDPVVHHNSLLKRHQEQYRTYTGHVKAQQD